MKRHSHLKVSRKRKHGVPDPLTLSSTTSGNPSIPFLSSEPLPVAPSNQHYQMSSEIRHKIFLSVWLGDNKGDPALKVSHSQLFKLEINFFLLEFPSSASRPSSRTLARTGFYWGWRKFFSGRPQQNIIHKWCPLPPQSSPRQLHIIWSSTLPRLSQSTHSLQHYGPFPWRWRHPPLLVRQDHWCFSRCRSTSQQTWSHPDGLFVGAMVWPQYFTSLWLEIKAPSADWICGQWRWTSIRFFGPFTGYPSLPSHPSISPWSYRWPFTTVDRPFRDRKQWRLVILLC